ncbi:MAG: T9SS type A sorting domain-containing protein, partial [Ignavibacteria bacterium]
QLQYSGNVKLEIFNTAGEKVAMIVDQKQNAGSYSVEWNAAGFPSGVYYYKLTSGTNVKTRKLVLIK